MSTMSARDFNRDVSAAKRAAKQEPVVITDRGVPAYVLMSIDDYRRRTAHDHDEFLNALSMDDDEDIDFPRMDFTPRAPEF